MGLALSKFLTALLLCFSIACSSVWARDVSIAMGNFAPYYIEKENSGIFADIISAVFRHIPNYQEKFVYGFSNKALWSSFAAGGIDAASNVFDSVEVEGCRTDPVFKFRDILVTKADTDIQLKTISDLKGKSVVSFEGARGFFGEDIAQNITGPYVELSKPELQVRVLVSSRYEVSIGDLFIFLQAIKNLGDEAISPEDFVFHDILPQLSSRMIFNDYTLCQQFNEGLKIIKNSGEYDQIYNGYLKSLGYLK